MTQRKMLELQDAYDEFRANPDADRQANLAEKLAEILEDEDKSNGEQND